MKNTFLTVALSVLFGCVDTVPEFKNVSTSLKSEAEFSIFSEILKTQNLEKFVQGSNLTVLAPTNEALGAIDYKRLKAAELEELVKNHIVERNLDNEKFLSGAVQTLGSEVYFSKDWDGKYTINGTSSVVGSSIFATNGTIFGINKVLQKPIGNIKDAIKSQASMSEFLNLVTLADPVVSQTIEKFSEKGITIFVPSNNAFDIYYQSKPKKEVIKEKDNLTSFLMSHIVERRIFTSDFSNNWGAFQSLNSASKILFVSDGLKIKGNLNSSNLLLENLLASNGVVHGVDSVLLPLH